MHCWFSSYQCRRYILGHLPCICVVRTCVSLSISGGCRDCVLREFSNYYKDIEGTVLMVALNFFCNLFHIVEEDIHRTTHFISYRHSLFQASVKNILLQAQRYCCNLANRCTWWNQLTLLSQENYPLLLPQLPSNNCLYNIMTNLLKNNVL